MAPAERADESPLIGEDLWRSTLIPPEAVPARFSKLAYGVKFSSDGGSVALAVAASDGMAAHIELPFCEPTARGTKWLVNWLAVRANQACSVVVDGKSGAGSLCDRLQELGTPKGYVIRPTTDPGHHRGETSFSKPPGDGGITHIECPALDLSAATATAAR